MAKEVSPLEKAIAAALKGAIAEKGTTAKDVAERLGVGSYPAFTQRLNGKVAMQLGEIVDIATLLGIDWHEILRRAEQSIQ
ncbi:helix-turn-helix transcriptional regulator [Gryllotalpicola koreensis]|uniref:XRE family transcriptional regulator n=1 Tax=Gryllotalpicola koreensis TaxID=993086 RepID=A0ABP8A260_9MICO